MDFRATLEKLDEIKRQHFLAEVEELMEKVGLRLADYTAAVRGITNDDERAKKIGEIARQYNFPGLFDPVSGKFVNAKDGKFAWFGGYEAEVRQLAAKGLIPDAAKTTAVLGLMGQDEKVAKPTSQTAEKLYLQIDKADELIKKALETPVKEGLAESLLKEFGINTNLLEAITPEEHQLINKTRKDIEPLLNAADGDAVEYKANYENYIRLRNELIAKINALIEAIKKMPAPRTATAPSGERRGSSATPANESVKQLSRQILSELSLTPQGQRAGARLYQPTATGYLTPQQSQHNLNMLKKGYAKLDPSDHLNQNIKDFANSATFGFGDKFASWLSSRGDSKTSYEQELLKRRAETDAYNRNKDALNLRSAVKAVTGYEMSPDNMFGNMTPGDVGGALITGTGLWNAGVKGMAKLGGGKVAQTAGGLTTSIVAPVTAALTIGEPTGRVGPRPPRPVLPQPAIDQNIQAFQKEVLKTDKKAFPKHGPDGIMGPEVQAAIAKYPEIAKKFNLGSRETPQQADSSPDQRADAQRASGAYRGGDGGAGSQANADTVYQGADTARSDVNQDAGQNRVPSSDTQVAQAAPSSTINFDQLQSALDQVGQVGDKITPEQLLKLADVMGIEGSAAAPATMAESSDLSRILKLSGMNEAAADALVRSAVTSAARSGADDAARAAAQTGSSIFSRGGDELTGNVFRKGGITWRKQADGYWVGTAKNGRKMTLSPEQMGLRQGKAAGKKAQAQSAVDANNAMVRGSVASRAADDAARAADDAARAGADDAARAGRSTVDNAVRGGADDAAKGWAYRLGRLGGRFARLVKNNKWLALLAALTALGIYMYNRDGSDEVRPQPGPNPDPNPNPRPQPGPGPDSEDKKREEERRRQLGELNELLKRLYGGWPTDAETAATIQAGVAVGGTAPQGFNPSGNVSTQPATGNGQQSSLSITQQRQNERTNQMVDQGQLPPSMRR